MCLKFPPNALRLIPYFNTLKLYHNQQTCYESRNTRFTKSHERFGFSTFVDILGCAGKTSEELFQVSFLERI